MMNDNWSTAGQFRDNLVRKGHWSVLARSLQRVGNAVRTGRTGSLKDKLTGGRWEVKIERRSLCVKLTKSAATRLCF